MIGKIVNIGAIIGVVVLIDSSEKMFVCQYAAVGDASRGIIMETAIADIKIEPTEDYLWIDSTDPEYEDHNDEVKLFVAFLKEFDLMDLMSPYLYKNMQISVSTELT